MSQLSISEVARQLGIKPSAIRYYEQIGLLRPPQRKSGQRRYDSTVLNRLAIVQRAQQTGFTLDEIRDLFFGFRDGMPASARWQALSRRKLAELESLIDQIKVMQRLLQKMSECCRCETLDECGRALLRKGSESRTSKSVLAKITKRPTTNASGSSKKIRD